LASVLFRSASEMMPLVASGKAEPKFTPGRLLFLNAVSSEFANEEALTAPVVPRTEAL
jgi:hypothetical protein